jgi:hydrogenase-1 operon protein HyaE
MSHPLIDRLTCDLGWPHLASLADVAALAASPGTHVVFVPGDPVRNLESADVAVILPELRQAFQGRFDCAVADATIEDALREATGVLKTPSLIFYREGRVIGAIPKVRDWSDYVTRIPQILAATVTDPTPEAAA